jgi:hypothetical protein
MRAVDNVEEQPLQPPKALRAFTWPQIRYWLMVAPLVIGGAAARGANSVMTPAIVIRPILLPAFSANQSAPSG